MFRSVDGEKRYRQHGRMTIQANEDTCFRESYKCAGEFSDSDPQKSAASASSGTNPDASVSKIIARKDAEMQKRKNLKK